MKFHLVLAAITFGVALMCGGPAAAQDAGRVAKARELIRLMEVEEPVHEMFETMSPMIAATAARDLRLSRSEEARLGELLAEEFRNAAPELIGAVAGIYANGMTDQHLDDTIAFMNSPAGQAWVDTQRNADAELERVGQTLGMRVALQAMTRFSNERAR